MQSTLTSADVQAVASGLLERHLRLKDYKRCTVSALLAVVFVACSRLVSLFAASRHLSGTPSHETIRKALRANLPSDLVVLERRLNVVLAACISRPLRRLLARRKQRIAIDLHLRPYHGKPLTSDDELVRGQPKSGTTHFHAYATAYLILKGQRFTLALTYVRAGEKMQGVLRRLLRRCAQLSIKPGLLLLDRGFWSVGVLRYLKAARYPFLMPVVARGKKAEQPGGPSGTRAFQYWKKGGWAEYELKEGGKGGKKARVKIGVHVRYRKGRRGKKGKERLVYAYWGWKPSSLRGMSEVYRGRFGIETSYRQLGEAKIKTCTRSPAVRLLLVALALVLRNVWVYLHHEVLSSPRRGKRLYNLARLTFRTMLAWLQLEAEKAFGVIDLTCSERPPPKGLAA